ncbi:hypothetical protein [Wenyingzhuangia sp. IMCC45574]
MKELQKWLRVNALFSTTSAVLMIILNEKLQVFFGFRNYWVFPIIGGNLIVFAMVIFWVLKFRLHQRKWVYLITFFDVLWVLGSMVLVFVKPFSLYNNAYIIITSIALIVGFLGWKQFKSVL